MTGEQADDRLVLRITGDDRVEFLQGLVTNDLRRLETDGIIYAALLSPQGKYLADFFLVAAPDAVLLDVKASLGEALARRLGMYKLRAKVTIETANIPVARGLGDGPAGAVRDPRHPSLGWRAYGHTDTGTAAIDWPAIRVAFCIPESGVELVPDDSYILECGFERLHGVDFRKGCYVGQEVTARMKHKTELRKGLARVHVTGDAETGTEITADGKPVGQILTRSGDMAIAYLRFDRASGPMRAGAAIVERAGDE